MKKSRKTSNETAKTSAHPDEDWSLALPSSEEMLRNGIRLDCHPPAVYRRASTTLVPPVNLAINKRSMELRALLIKKPFIDQILSGQKTWELRGSASKIRGQIALIESGSGTVVGTCELVDVVGPLSKQDLKKNAAKLNAKASDFDGPLYYAKTYAWVLKSAKRLKTPVPYDHASGAVIWVKLDARVAKRVRR